MSDRRSVMSTRALDALSGPDRAGIWLYMLLATGGGFVFGWPSVLVAELLAAAIIFVVVMPVTALALNGGRPLGQDQDPFGWNPRVQHGLLIAWVHLTWVAAWVCGPR